MTRARALIFGFQLLSAARRAARLIASLAIAALLQAAVPCRCAAAAVPDETPAALRLAAMSQGALAALAAGSQQDVLVVLDQSDAIAAAARIRAEEGLAYDGHRGLRAKAQLYAATKSRLLAALATAAASGGGSVPEVLRDYQEMPILFVRVHNLDELQELAGRPEVTAIEDNRVYHNAAAGRSIADPLAWVRQPQVAAAGLVGTGTVVAILDTPIKSDNPGFPQCTAHGQPTPCIVASMDETGGHGDPAALHGTNVAGIVLSTAPDTRIAAVTVLSLDPNLPDGRTDSNTLIAALDWCVGQKDLEGLNVSVVNMSLSLGDQAPPCSFVDPALTDGFAVLTAANILPVAAAGNSGLSTELALPACMPSVVSVGAIYDANLGPQPTPPAFNCTDQTTAADQVTCFSNVAASLNLLAPGADIIVADTTFAGTSQAAPFVSGAAAVLRAAFPQETLTQTLSRMTSTGMPVSRPGAGFSTPRLNLWAAAQQPTQGAATVSLSATPAVGASPLPATLAATFSGGSGPITYNFWWNCNDPRSDSIAVQEACGALPVAAAGTCAANANGEQCAAVTANPQSVSHVYIGTAADFGKVIAVRGAASAEATAVMAVTAAPAVTTTPAVALTASGATLNGGVNGQMAATSAWFEWGTASGLSPSTLTAAQPLPVSGSSQAVAAGLAGLNPNTTYWYRAAANNAGGTVRGSTLSFTTPSTGLPPAASTGAASAVTANSAVITGLVDPFGLDTRFDFEWGTDPAFSAPNLTGVFDIGAGSTALPVSANLSGLSAGTTYYYRVSATNLAGTERGVAMNFQTLAPSQQQLIGNGGFESGTSPWVTSGAFQIAAGFPNPHSGSGYAFLGLPNGTAANGVIGTLDQTVTIPAGTASALLTFWYSVSSQDSTTVPFDFLDVTLEDAQGNYLLSVAVLTNLNQGAASAYRQISYDLTPNLPLLAGQTVRLHFLGTTDQSLPTLFRIDDVSLLAATGAPTVTTGAASGVTSQTATIGGSVNPGGSDTGVWFEWGTSPTLAPYTQSPPQDIGAGNSPLPVSANLAALSPGTTWYYRAAAANANATARGAIASLTTSAGAAPPPIGTLPASAVGSSAATLGGTVITGSSTANAWFEWGTDPALASYQVTPTQVLPASSSPATVQATLGGLSGSTTYYFRIAASNAAGTSRAAVLAFTTAAAPAPPQTLTVAAGNIAGGGVAITVTPGDLNGQAGATTPFNRLYASGTAVTLMAPATAAGEAFLEWIDNGVVLTSSPTASVTLTSNSTLTAVYGSTGGGVQVLALGLDSPTALAVDSTNVYWLEGNALRKIAKAGGSPANLAGSLTNPVGLAVGGGFAFIGENLAPAGDTTSGQCRIDRLTLDGLSSLALATDASTVTRLAVDGSNVYWTDNENSIPGAGTVRSVSRSGGAVTMLATGSTEPLGIAADGTNVYWTEFSSPGRLQSVPASGGASSILAIGTNSAGVASGVARVFWTRNVFVNQGEVDALPAGGGLTTQLATGLDYPWDLAYDGVNVYWIGSSSSGTVQQVAASGGSPILLAAGLSWPVAVATDGAFVYWLERGDGGPASGSLKRVPVSPCAYTFAPASATLTAGGGTGSIAVSAPAGCAWTAVSDESWITLTGGAAGNGAGTLTYSVGANGGSGPRLGTVHIQGQVFTVDQAGALSTATRWARTYGGGAQGDVAHATAATADGGLAVAGFTGFGAGGEDAMVERLDGSGNVVWVQTFGGAHDDEANAIAATPDGGFLVAGDTASFGAGGADGWLFKLDSAGHLVWQRTYGGSGTDTLNAVAMTADGGIITAGFTSSFGAGQSDVWVLRLDAAGNVVWQATYGGTGNESDPLAPGCGLLQTADGGFAVVVSSFSFSGGEGGVWALKLDASGNVQWQTVYGGSGSWYANDLAAAADGGFWVAGTMAPSSSAPLAWVAKLAPQGTIDWQETFGGGNIAYGLRGLAAASDGGVVVGGAGQGAWLAKLDATGTVEWSKSWSGAPAVFDSVVQLADGSFAAAGPGQLGTTWSQFFVLRVDPSGAISPSCTAWGDSPQSPVTANVAAASTTAVTAAATAVTPGVGSAVAGLPPIAVVERCAACSPPPSATVSLAPGQAGAICGGAPAIVQATLTGTAPWTLTWSDGVIQSGITASPATRQVTPAATTSYSVATVSDATCTGVAAGSAPVSVTPAGPSPVLGNNGPLCAGATLQLTAPAVASGIYTWTGPASFTSTAQSPAIPAATTAASGSYSATITTNGCPSLPGTTAVTVSPVPPAPAASSNSPVCAGTPLLLGAATIPGATYSWSGPGAFSAVGQKVEIASATAATAGTYGVAAMLDGCTSAAATTPVTVLPAPAATVSGGGSFCPGTGTRRSVTVQAALVGTPPWTLTWSDGVVQSGITASPATRVVAPATATSYSVLSVTDAQCSGTATGGAIAEPSCRSFFFTVPPCRIIDTRQPAGPQGGPALNAGQQRTVQVSGVCAIPSTARSVVLNVTAVTPTAAGFLNLFAADQALPGTSAISYAAGAVRANNAVTLLSAGGALNVYASQPSGTVHFLIDVSGYFE